MNQEANERDAKVQLKDIVSAQELKMWVTNAVPTELEEEEEEKDQMVFQLRQQNLK